jgi:hypothetical protein
MYVGQSSNKLGYGDGVSKCGHCEHCASLKQLVQRLSQIHGLFCFSSISSFIIHYSSYSSFIILFCFSSLDPPQTSTSFSQVFGLVVRSRIVQNDDLDAVSWDTMPTAKSPLHSDEYLAKLTYDRPVRDESNEYSYASLLNGLLPTDIRVLGWSPVAPTFDARFYCIGRYGFHYFSLVANTSPFSQPSISISRPCAKPHLYVAITPDSRVACQRHTQFSNLLQNGSLETRHSLHSFRVFCVRSDSG